MKKDEEYTERDDLGNTISNFDFLNEQIEYSCYLDFYYTFDLEEKTSNLSNLKELCNILDIDCNIDLIIEKYSEERFRDVLVFHSKTEEYSFIYFDLEKEMTDQSNLFLLGISCNIKKEPEIYKVLLKISKNQGSLFKDFDKRELFNEVYFSFEHFYNRHYNKYKKQMKHYGK